MLETDSQFPINFRQEILTRFFNYIQSAESFYVVGSASMGKTRLLDFLTKEEVQRYYLGEKMNRTWLVRVDLNRLSIKSEPWAFYELLLSSIALEVNRHEDMYSIRPELIDLDAKVIQSHDLLLALRFLEMAVNRLCQMFGVRLCFMLDEFDEVYRNLSSETFAQLRAVRDANKPLVSFAVFLRNTPEQLRPTRDNESFYELLSRNMLALGPYSRPDSLNIIQQLEQRRAHPLTPAVRERLYEASGGHIGLVQALYGLLIENPKANEIIGTGGWLEWFGRQSDCIEECRKIWDGISDVEKDGLSAFANGEFDKIFLSVEKMLFAKGLLRRDDGEARFFSPIFEQYIHSLR